MDADFPSLEDSPILSNSTTEIHIPSGGVLLTLLLDSVVCLLALLWFFCCQKRLPLFQYVSRRKNDSAQEHEFTPLNNFEEGGIENIEPTLTTTTTIPTTSLNTLPRWQQQLYKWGKIIFGRAPPQYDRIATIHGKQAAVYLFFEHQFILAVSFCMVLSLSILLPLHLTGDVPELFTSQNESPSYHYNAYNFTKEDYPLLRTTVNMVMDSPSKLYIHVLLSAIFASVFIFFLYRWASSPITCVHPRYRVSDLSLRISNLPSDFIHHDLLSRAASRLLVLANNDSNGFYDNNQSNENQEEDNHSDVLGASIPTDVSELLKLQKRWDYVREQLEHYRALNKKRNSRERILVRDRFTSFQNESNLENDTLNSFQNDDGNAPDCCSWHRVDALHYYNEQLSNIEKEIQQWKDSGRQWQSAGYGFIMFQTPEAAQMVQQFLQRKPPLFLHDLLRRMAIERLQAYRDLLAEEEERETPHQIDSTEHDQDEEESLVVKEDTKSLESLCEGRLQPLGVNKPHEPHEIEWENLTAKPINRHLRTAAVGILLTVILIFFSSPMAIVSGLGTITQTEVVSQGVVKVKSFLKIGGSLGSALFQYLPTFILFLVSVLMPIMISILTVFEKKRSKAAAGRATILRLYVYLIISTLILPSTLLTSVQAIVKSILENNLESGLRRMFLPESGAFFINFLIQYALLCNSVELLRLADLLRYLWKRYQAVTPEEREKALQISEFYYPIEYAYLIGLMAIMLAYSTFSPLILLVGVFHLIFKHCVDRHNLLHVCAKTEGSDRYPDTRSYYKNIRLVCALMLVNTLVFLGMITAFFAGHLHQDDHSFLPHFLIMISLWILFLGITVFFPQFVLHTSPKLLSKERSLSLLSPHAHSYNTEDEESDELVEDMANESGGDPSGNYAEHGRPLPSGEELRSAYVPPSMIIPEINDEERNHNL
eukprot:gb/GECH01006044.1/.p1 GENE.gb/GECH01006044.1/~~gb/GECH01006044.1/.p1  ORF type:complete len:938 (+),score=148.86 gb/GECH01006044.1/:1-2814(+)